jgi:predicted S18 family serine protease
MFVVCVPIIAWTYWARPYAYEIVQLQIAVLIVGTIAAAVVWYFFGEVIVESATRIYETLRGQDVERARSERVYNYAQPDRTRTYGGAEETKYCISCGAEIPRRARFCRECRAEQQ